MGGRAFPSARTTDTSTVAGSQRSSRATSWTLAAASQRPRMCPTPAAATTCCSSSVHALQDATTLTPVNTEAAPAGLAVPDPAVPESIAFLEKLRVLSQRFPPADRDLPVQQSLAPIGITAAESPYVDLPQETLEAPEHGLNAVKAALQGEMTTTPAESSSDVHTATRKSPHRDPAAPTPCAAQRSATTPDWTRSYEHSATPHGTAYARQPHCASSAQPTRAAPTIGYSIVRKNPGNAHRALGRWAFRGSARTPS